MKGTKMKNITIALLSLVLAVLIPSGISADCFGWSITKRASYMELLPQMLYYDKVNWINLDPNRTCTMKVTEAVFLKLYNSNMVASY